eukprot:5318737-Amphidinium_carterae.1
MNTDNVRVCIRKGEGAQWGCVKWMRLCHRFRLSATAAHFVVACASCRSDETSPREWSNGLARRNGACLHSTASTRSKCRA